MVRRWLKNEKMEVCLADYFWNPSFPHFWSARTFSTSFLSSDQQCQKMHGKIMKIPFLFTQC